MLSIIHGCVFYSWKFDIAQRVLVIGMIGRVNAIKGQRNDFIKASQALLEKNEQAEAF